MGRIREGRCRSEAMMKKKGGGVRVVLDREAHYTCEACVPACCCCRGEQ